MKKSGILFFFILSLLITVSCNRKGDVLTDRIQYDVTIISPEQDLDWWVQNLENNKRETLVKNIMEQAKSGEHKVYDVISFKELTPQEIQERSNQRQLMTLQREYAPYEEYDTLVVKEIDLSNISKVRFLEEWYLNQESGLITKKVIAICPMLESYTESGELRGHLPLYWISFQKKFPLGKK